MLERDVLSIPPVFLITGVEEELFTDSGDSFGMSAFLRAMLLFSYDTRVLDVSLFEFPASGIPSGSHCIGGSLSMVVGVSLLLISSRTLDAPPTLCFGGATVS